METANKRIFSQAGPWGIVLRATAILVFGLGFFININNAAAEETCGNSKLDTGEDCDKGSSCDDDCTCPLWFTPDGDTTAPGCSDPCLGVAFSTPDDTNTAQFGCSVAAALHHGGTSLDSVRAHVARYSKGQRGAKWLERYNKGLLRLAKDTFWGTFSHSFGKREIASWDDAAFVEKLVDTATRLDVLHQHRRTDLKVLGLVKSASDLKADTGAKACPDPAAPVPDVSLPSNAPDPAAPAASPPPTDPPVGTQTP